MRVSAFIIAAGPRSSGSADFVVPTIDAIRKFGVDPVCVARKREIIDACGLAGTRVMIPPLWDSTLRLFWHTRTEWVERVAVLVADRIYPEWAIDMMLRSDVMSGLTFYGDGQVLDAVAFDKKSQIQRLGRDAGALIQYAAKGKTGGEFIDLYRYIHKMNLSPSTSVSWSGGDLVSVPRESVTTADDRPSD